MSDFTITERTEPFTLDEVFSFIDDTNISEMDACELKSRIVDMVQAEKPKCEDCAGCTTWKCDCANIRAKAIEDFVEALHKKCDGMIAHTWNGIAKPISWASAYADFKDDIDEIAEEMRGAE